MTNRETLNYHNHCNFRTQLTANKKKNLELLKLKSPEKLCRTEIVTSKEGAVHVWYRYIRSSEKGLCGTEIRTLKEA